MAALLLAVLNIALLELSYKQIRLGKKVKKTQGGDPLRLFLYYS